MADRDLSRYRIMASYILKGDDYYTQTQSTDTVFLQVEML